MMDEKEKTVVSPQKQIEELNDTQLNEVSGGLGLPTLPGSNRPGGLKLGQALKPNTSFTKSDDRLP